MDRMSIRYIRPGDAARSGRDPLDLPIYLMMPIFFRSMVAKTAQTSTTPFTIF
jgi:hypothetical protein